MAVGASATLTLDATESSAWFRRLGQGKTRIALPGTWVGTVIVERQGPNGTAYTIMGTDGALASFTENPGLFETNEAGPLRLSFTRTSGTIDAIAWSDESQIETLS